MQDAGGGLDWQHSLSALAGSVFGALASIGTLLYRAGGKEPKLRSDFQEKLTEAEHRVDEKMDELVRQFKESFDGIRRQIDDHRLDNEKRFVLKDDFRDFREEYREDMRDLKDSIAAIAKQQ